MNTKALIFTVSICLPIMGVGAGESSHHNQHGTGMKTGQAATVDSGTIVQNKCPVMGGVIDKKVYVDHEGQRIYFCCESCVSEFKKEPAKYLNKMHAEGVTLEKIGNLVPQTTCPVMGKPVNKKLFVDHQGKRVYLCCGTCVKEFKKNPEKYLKKMHDSGEMPQTL